DLWSTTPLPGLTIRLNLLGLVRGRFVFRYGNDIGKNCSDNIGCKLLEESISQPCGSQMRGGLVKCEVGNPQLTIRFLGTGNDPAERYIEHLSILTNIGIVDI